MTHTGAAGSDVAAAAFDAVEAAATERGLLVTRLPSTVDGILGIEFQGTKRSWQLDVSCVSDSVTRLPHVWLRAPRRLHAHVGYDGGVCIGDFQGLSLDPDRRQDLVAYTALAAYDLLEKWYADEVANKTEFLNELEGYWAGLPGIVKVRGGVEPDGVDRLVLAHVDRNSTPAKWYVVEFDATKPPQGFELKDTDVRGGLYVHLDEPFDPPVHPFGLEPTFLKQLVASFSPRQLELWTLLMGITSAERRHLVLLVSVPRAAGGRSLVGVAFDAFEGAVDITQDVTPLAVRRQTATYMRERGGAATSLMQKHVVVVGCGAVGAVVADNLAAAGVGRITLVDADLYSEDNVFRHILHPVWIDDPKVTGLRYRLEQQYPGIQVQPYVGWFQDWLKSADFGDVDAFAFALGLPTLERSFSRTVRARCTKPTPMVFTWLEPLDLGGHSVVVSSVGAGCLDCLYRDDDGLPSLQSRIAFLQHNQPIAKNLTGCSSIFVPYGALQARRTGLMAAEHLLASMSGVPAPTYRSWAGEGGAAREQGLKTTPWWDLVKALPPSEANQRAFGLPCKRCRPVK